MNNPTLQASILALAEEAAKKYAQEFGGFPKGASLIAVNGHTRGWDDCAQAMLDLLAAREGEVTYTHSEVKYLRECDAEDYSAELARFGAEIAKWKNQALAELAVQRGQREDIAKLVAALEYASANTSGMKFAVVDRIREALKEAGGSDE